MTDGLKAVMVDPAAKVSPGVYSLKGSFHSMVSPRAFKRRHAVQAALNVESLLSAEEGLQQWLLYSLRSL